MIDRPLETPKKKGFGARFGIAFRSKTPSSQPQSRSSSIAEQNSAEVRRSQDDQSSRSRLSKTQARNNSVAVTKLEKQGAIAGGAKLRKRQGDFPSIDVSEAWERDEQTGETKDHTDLLHSLAHVETRDSVYNKARLAAADVSKRPGDYVVSKLSHDLWQTVAEYLTPADTASIAFSCKAFREMLGYGPWKALDRPGNHRERVNFLLHMDEDLPGHLLCFPCAMYHKRTQQGHETLKPTNISNPLFDCPYAAVPKSVSRIRITFGRALPFTFVQLAMRGHLYSPNHGITIDSLSRRYKDRESSSWAHLTRYAVVNGHLLMRVVSTTFAAAGLPPAGLRHLLYSRDDFVPYFSVCSHWRDGELMPLVKCAMSHIPKPLEGSGIQRVAKEVQQHIHRPTAMVTLCADCRPMRRCPECATEYLIEVKIQEDKSDPAQLFKQALVVTRWSDLGDGSTPWSPEWAAVNGEARYDSFQAIGKRAVSGTFEAEFNKDLIPGQNLKSLNPNNEKRGEAGHNWY